MDTLAATRPVMHRLWNAMIIQKYLGSSSLLTNLLDLRPLDMISPSRNPRTVSRPIEKAARQRIRPSTMAQMREAFMAGSQETELSCLGAKQNDQDRREMHSQKTGGRLPHTRGSRSKDYW